MSKNRARWVEPIVARTGSTRADFSDPNQEAQPVRVDRLVRRGDLKKKARRVSTAGFHNSGDVLLSHRASPAVPSALIGLTSEFGMGSGVTLPTLPPNL